MLTICSATGVVCIPHAAMASRLRITIIATPVPQAPGSAVGMNPQGATLTPKPLTQRSDAHTSVAPAGTAGAVGTKGAVSGEGAVCLAHGVVIAVATAAAATAAACFPKNPKTNSLERK